MDDKKTSLKISALQFLEVFNQHIFRFISDCQGNLAPSAVLTFFDTDNVSYKVTLPSGCQFDQALLATFQDLHLRKFMAVKCGRFVTFDDPCNPFSRSELTYDSDNKML